MVSFKGLLLFLALGTNVLAQPAPDVTCSTKLGAKSTKYILSKTSTKTKTITQTQKVYTSKDTTMTPKPKTVTISETKTITHTSTASGETDTATAWDTITSTDFTTNTDTTTFNEVSTTTITSTSTTTIPTPAGFIPIKNGGGWTAKKRDAESLVGRAVKKDNILVQCPKNSKPQLYPPQYPQSVDCVRTVSKTVTKKITVAVKGKTTTLAPQTKTNTATVTETATTTEYPPNVSTTVTSTTSTTVTSTVNTLESTTVTATSTVENVASETFVAACGNDNIAGTVNGGQSIKTFGSTVGSPQLAGSTASQYECCVLCMNTPNCKGSFSWGSSCYVYASGTCTPGQTGGISYYTGSTGSPALVSNGQCGMFSYAGTSPFG